MTLVMVLLLLDWLFAKPISNVILYVLHLEDSQEDMLLTSSQCCQHTESVYPKMCSEEQIQKISKCQINIIGVEQDN